MGGVKFLAGGGGGGLVDATPLQEGNESVCGCVCLGINLEGRASGWAPGLRNQNTVELLQAGAGLTLGSGSGKELDSD